jgi:tRNA-specific 2-thiouridylase
MNAALQSDLTRQAACAAAEVVAVAMSGGVDSSVVAALMQEQNRTVIGLTMQLWNHRRFPAITAW